MAETLDGKTIWNEAGRAGIALGGLCIACTLATMGLNALGGGTMVKFFISVFGFLLWALKFGGCIWLMQYFMKKLVASYDDVTNHDTYILGVESALLSALIVAAFSMAQMMFISPEDMRMAMEEAMKQYAAVLDSNSQAVLDSLLDKLPVISLFSNLFYCFVYGWVLSAILSKNIPSSNPFDRY